jgi:hypothetical protein
MIWLEKNVHLALSNTHSNLIFASHVRSSFFEEILNTVSVLSVLRFTSSDYPFWKLQTFFFFYFRTVMQFKIFAVFLSLLLLFITGTISQGYGYGGYREYIHWFPIILTACSSWEGVTSMLYWKGYAAATLIVYLKFRNIRLFFFYFSIEMHNYRYVCLPSLTFILCKH